MSTPSKTANVWLLIPAYNAKPHIISLLNNTFKWISADRTVVVDDGSTDGTAELLASTGVNIITHPVNIGKGAALRSGIAYILKQEGEWIMTMDADGQHPPEFIPEFCKAAATGKYDIIIGARRRSGEMPFDRRCSNWSTSRLLSLITKQSIIDSQCGYRLIRAVFLKNIAFKYVKYDFETELLLRMIKADARLGWINIPTYYSGELSSIRRVIDTIRFLRVIIQHLNGTLYRS